MRQIIDWVESTTLIDTHEHLIEESDRLSWNADSSITKELGLFPCDDWSYVFWHYLPDDFVSSGMSLEDKQRFFDPESTTEEKHRLIAPWWERCKHTGYGQAVRLTLQGLYGESDLTAESAPRLAEKYNAMVRPGFYREILRERCGIEHCHVNSIETVFKETEQPDLLRQDIGFDRLSTSFTPEQVESRGAKTLDDWIGVISDTFARFGPLAVAAKNPCAYMRPLDFAAPDQSAAERTFAKLAAGVELGPEERRTLEDFLFDLCITKATEHGLPVKLHTGYMTGVGYMPLGQVKSNYSDVCTLLQRHPETRFVLMHIGYPYWHEAIALAKHYPNVVIDMCWAWILSPVAASRFLVEFLVAAPANKVLVFGGDYVPVEPICGHSQIARRGIAQSITQLVEEGWLRVEEARPLIERIMHGNAKELFREPAL